METVVGMVILKSHFKHIEAAMQAIKKQKQLMEGGSQPKGGRLDMQAHNHIKPNTSWNIWKQAFLASLNLCSANLNPIEAMYEQLQLKV